MYDLCRLESGSYRSVDILTEHGRITVREGTDDPGHTFSIQVLAHEVLLEQRAGAVQRRLF